MAVTLLYYLKVDHRPDGPLEILVSGTCLPDEPLKLRFTPTDLSSIPTSLNPTSNGDVVHPRKMPLYGHLPVFSHNQSVLAGHTENPDGVPNVQQQQIRLRLGVFTSEITGRPVLLLALPRPKIVRPHRLPDGVCPNLFPNLTHSPHGGFLT